GAAERAAVTRGMPGTAAVEGANVINDAIGSINETAVERLVAVLLAAAPAVDVRLRDEEAISAQRPGRHGFTEADKAFARGRIGRKTSRGARGKVIPGFDVEGHASAGDLTREGRAEEAGA